MADRVLFISWRTPVRGREERGLEVFNESMGLDGRMQQEGRIEKFDVVLLEPSGGLNGYIELRGSAEQLAAIREEEEIQRNTIEASLIVDGLRHIEGITNNEIARQMALYQESVARIRRPLDSQVRVSPVPRRKREGTGARTMDPPPRGVSLLPPWKTAAAIRR